MSSCDIYCRSISFPKCYKDGIFDTEQNFTFDKIEESLSFSLSVCSLKMLKTFENVHLYGCRMAAAKNERIAAKLQTIPKPILEKSHYLGYYEMYAGEVPAISLEHYQIELVHLPENGEDAHYEIQMHLKAGASPTKKQRQTARLVAATAVLSIAMGPRRSICECDSDVAEELAEMALPRIAFKLCPLGQSNCSINQPFSQSFF